VLAARHPSYRAHTCQLLIIFRKMIEHVASTMDSDNKSVPVIADDARHDLRALSLDIDSGD
jgi:hypothetical protein